MMIPGQLAHEPMNGSFPLTHWSLVLRAASPASTEARIALDELCRAYWYPIYAFIRRKGNDPDRAVDLTQDFFVHLLEKDVLASAREGRGRFRAFLRVVCKNFLVDGWRKRPADSKVRFSIDARDAENRYQIEPVDNTTPEHVFDHAWAIILLDRALATLAAKYAETGRAALFDQIKVVLTEGKGAVAVRVLAERLDISENAVNVATHRLRREYREVLLQEIAATLADPSDLDDEISSLFDAIRPEVKNARKVS
jgi:RNA polymerase sigma-70 factor (ECF subfamily)